MQLCLAREKPEYARAMQVSALRINRLIYSALAPDSFEDFWRGKPRNGTQKKSPSAGRRRGEVTTTDRVPAMAGTDHGGRRHHRELPDGRAL
jgi:hypothetical protein